MREWIRMLLRRPKTARALEDQDRPGEMLNVGDASDSARIVASSGSPDAAMHVRVTTLAEAGRAEHNPGHSGAFDVVDVILAALLIGAAVLASYFWNRSWFSAVWAPSAPAASASQHPSARTAAAVHAIPPEATPPSFPPSSQSRHSSPGGLAPGQRDNSRPEPVVLMPASYTDQARYARFHGRVYVVVAVSKTGLPARVEMTAPLPFDLEPAVRLAVAQWRFRPAIRNGQPVDATAVFEVSFR